MTALLLRLWVWVRGLRISPMGWLVLALVLLVVVLGLYASGQRRARLAAEREAEALELRARGLLVAEDAKASVLRADLGALEKEFAGLRAALDDAKAKAGAVRLVEVARIVTVPGPVQYVPRPAPVGECVLASGETGEIRIAEMRLQTKAGNSLAVGVAEAWRIEPGPPAMLFSSAFQASASKVRADLSATTPEPSPGWGFGPMAVVGTGGWSVGVLASPPPLRLWDLKLEGFAGVAVGSQGNSGNVEGVLGVLFRR